MGLIYRATNLVNGKIYIGQTVRTLHKRKLEHLNEAIKKESNFIFHKAIRKYENHNFKWEILGYCNNWEELKESNPLFNQKFQRMWQFYLIFCKVGFKIQKLHLVQFIFTIYYGATLKDFGLEY